MERNWAVRAVSGVGILLGVAVFAYYGVERPGWIGVNYRVYHAAATAVLEGGSPYAVTPPGSSFHYLYPPVTLLAFLPSALAGNWVPGYVAITCLSVLATAYATNRLLDFVAALGYAVPTSDRFLVGGLLLASSHAAPSLVYGQVNHLLVAAIAVGAVALASGAQTRAGVALALPAFVKVVPAGIGVWLLARRAWRAIGAAVATAIGLTLAGLVAFGPATYRTYVFDALLPRRDAGAFAGGLDPAVGYVTLRRPLSVLFPTADPAWYAVGAGALLVPVLATLYWRVETVTDRLVAIHGTLVATVLFFPSLLLYAMYLVPTTVLLLYDLPAGRARRAFVAGALLSLVSMSASGLRDVLAVIPVDPATTAVVESVLVPVLAFGTPVLYGSILMLGACVDYRLGTAPLASLRYPPASRRSR